MTTNSFNHNTFGKLSALLFVRQTPQVAADRHPSILAQIKAWRGRRVAAAELSGLSDRDLADIGLTRQEIPEVVRRDR